MVLVNIEDLVEELVIEKNLSLSDHGSIQLKLHGRINKSRFATVVFNFKGQTLMN